MDFKVAGTSEFITAIQLDTKLEGIPASVLISALAQAREARLAILSVMHEAIDAPDEMSPHAPRVLAVTVQIGRASCRKECRSRGAPEHKKKREKRTRSADRTR